MNNIINLIKDNIQYHYFTKEFNGKRYKMAFTVFNPYESYSMYIEEQEFKKIEITNILDNFQLSCELVFIDNGGYYTSLFTHIGEFLAIYIMPESELFTKEKPNFMNLFFTVENHEVLNMDLKTIEYKLHCSLYINKYLNAHVNYATSKKEGKERSESPYNIIKTLLQKIDLPINTEIPICSHNIHYISDQNRNVFNDIKYCLEYATSTEDAPAYLYYHIIDQEIVFFKQDFILKNINYKCNYNLILQNDNGIIETELENNTDNNSNNDKIIFDLKSAEPNLNNTFFNDSALTVFWKYSHNSRKWTSISLTPSKCKDLLSFSEEEQNIQSIYPDETYEENSIRYYNMNQEHNLYNSLHNIEVGANTISFCILGNIVRDCGQIININCKNINYYNKFGGMWNIYAITHEFEARKIYKLC